MLELLFSAIFNKYFLIVTGFILAIYYTWKRNTPRRSAINKAVFITGCDSGMGHRMARRLDEMKMHVFAGCLYPDGQGARELKEYRSSRLHIVPLDITSDKMVDEAVVYVRKNLPAGETGLYCLVNNAGILPYLNFDLTTLDICREAIDVNIMGTIRVTKKFLPLIHEVPGRIITITSIMARLTYPNLSVYCATKHALDAFFSTLRLELGSSGVQIATIEPGDFSTTTNILQYTESRLKDIWNSMSENEKYQKAKMFEQATGHFRKTKLPINEQERNYCRLIEDIEDAMFSEDPHIRYVTASRAHKVMYSIFRILPESLYWKIISKSLR